MSDCSDEIGTWTNNNCTSNKNRSSCVPPEKNVKCGYEVFHGHRRYADERTVDIMKVYNERNNFQVELSLIRSGKNAISDVD